ncbi:unnamed protein product [Linum trigynum]|uniref:Gnk2-homologous domain-containing protein n=1 Tax=Linum trigynum TaxID=586398 RepID=A0AAV2GFY0_9ROSI
MVSIAFLLRLDLTVTTTIAIFFFAVLSFPDGKNPACITPDDEHLFNYACNKEKLPDTSKNVQKDLLDFIDRKLHSYNYGGNLCDTDTPTGGLGTTFAVFGGCNDSRNVTECTTCLTGARGVVTQICPDAVGAQASSKICCVRYEKYGFCK